MEGLYYSGTEKGLPTYQVVEWNDHEARLSDHRAFNQTSGYGEVWNPSPVFLSIVVHSMEVIWTYLLRLQLSELILRGIFNGFPRGSDDVECLVSIPSTIDLGAKYAHTHLW